MSKLKSRKISNPPLKDQTRNKNWYAFRNKSEGDSEVHIDIMEDIGMFGVTAKQFKNDLKRYAEKEDLHVHINSDGGDVIQGNEIFNILMDHPGEVRVTIGAMAASIASVIAMAGDRISIAKNGFMMIHNPWSIAVGDAEEFENTASVLKKMKSGIIDAYRRHSGLSVEEISDLMDKETYMDSEEAMANGFVQSIEDRDAEESLMDLNLGRFLNSEKFLKRPEVAQLLGKGGNSPRQPAGGNSPQGASGTAEEQQEVEQPTQPIERVIVDKPMKQEGQQAPAAPADPEAVKKEALKIANQLYADRIKMDQEIDDIVVKVRDRDHKDFGELAATYKRDQKTADEFARAIATSDNFKKFEVVGSGIEVIEPLDALKGSPGFHFVNSDEYKNIAEHAKRGRGSIPQNSLRRVDLPITVRDIVNGRFFNAPAEPTSTGLTSIQKMPGVVELGVRPLMVKDLIAPGATQNTTIRYIREVSFTNYATPVAEGVAKPEALFEYAEVDAPVRKIAAYTKVTDELFADYLAVASYINQRLPYMVERTEEDQLLNGDGVAPDLTGILQTAGIQTQAKGGDTVPDAIYKAMTKIRFTGFFEPDGFVIHPNDWQDLRLLKDGNNQYYGGGPFTGAYGNSPLVQFDSIWGKPCVITPAIAEGTALAGAFRLGSQYFQRQGITIEMTNSDQDDFIKNRMTIRCEERLALAVYRPLAFCQVTGI